VGQGEAPMTLLVRQQQAAGPLVSVTPADAGWQYIHFAAHLLAAGERLEAETAGLETALVILGGRATVTGGGCSFGSVGDRRDVWERRPPYVVILPPNSAYVVAAETDLHLVVAGAPADGGLPPRLIRPEEMVAEERGAGQTRRYIHHLLPPSAPAARLLLTEVYTPAGNWSSFPPHKHDSEEPPAESWLEETYYYQIQPPAGFAVQRVYTDDRSLDQTMAPGNGDLVLVPRGYHPVAATPGHECYYLNVMAGPARAWNFRVDPAYAHLMNWQKPDVTKG